MNNQNSRRRRRPPFIITNHYSIRKQSLLLLCLFLQLLSITSTTSANNNNEEHQKSNNNIIAPDERKLQNSLNLGSVECANCSGPNQQCSGTTIQDMHCIPCSSGQAWWPCNIANECYCKDVSTDNPTSSPVKKQDETNRPSSSMMPTIDYQNIARPGSSSSSSGSSGGSPTTGIVDAQQQQQQYEIPKSSIDPNILQGLYVMDAHLSANKIVLTRELLSSPGTIVDDDNNFSYIGFRNSLHTMITTGISNNSTFYIGESSNKINGRVYGLVNIATFLSQSYESSIKYNSCDEINMDVVDGYLPISNACGQYGIDYQTMGGDSECDSKYACELDLNMRMNANEATVLDSSSSTRNEGGNNDDPAKPFYCAPKSDYGGSTGYWDYVSGTEIQSPAVMNSVNRKDVQGCCWWGRGSLSLRGTCSYGKLNYYLGKRAHDEGRPSLYPDIDFCDNPQTICSNSGQYPELKWIAGMFRWITEIQVYNRGSFNYMQELINFVDGGLQDMSFIHGVSGIVTQGCHDPPCANKGGEFNGASRKATFIKTLGILGLKVNDGTSSQ